MTRYRARRSAFRDSVFQARLRESAVSSSIVLSSLPCVGSVPHVGRVVLGLFGTATDPRRKTARGVQYARPVRGLMSARLGRSELPRGDDREFASRGFWASETIAQGRDCP